MSYILVYFRYGRKITEQYPTLDGAMKAAHRLLEFEFGWPDELWEGDILLYTNAKGVPWKDGSCAFSDAIGLWAKVHEAAS